MRRSIATFALVGALAGIAAGPAFGRLPPEPGYHPVVHVHHHSTPTQPTHPPPSAHRPGPWLGP